MWVAFVQNIYRSVSLPSESDDGVITYKGERERERGLKQKEHKRRGEVLIRQDLFELVLNIRTNFKYI